MFGTLLTCRERDGLITAHADRVRVTGQVRGVSLRLNRKRKTQKRQQIKNKRIAMRGQMTLMMTMTSADNGVGTVGVALTPIGKATVPMVTAVDGVTGRVDAMVIVEGGRVAITEGEEVVDVIEVTDKPMKAVEAFSVTAVAVPDAVNVFTVIGAGDAVGVAGPVDAVGVAGPVDAVGVSGSVDAVGVSGPVDAVGVSGAGDAVGVAGPVDAVWVSGAGDAVWVSGAGDAVGVAGPVDAVGVSGAGDAVGVSGAGDAVGVAGAGDAVGVSGAGDAVGVAGAGDAVGVSGAGDAVGVSGAGDAVGVSGAGDAVGVSVGAVGGTSTMEVFDTTEGDRAEVPDVANNAGPGAVNKTASGLVNGRGAVVEIAGAISTVVF